ncbi:MAG: nucleotide exchange factor GrpE [Promethearchaeota archaeon]
MTNETKDNETKINEKNNAASSAEKEKHEVEIPIEKTEAEMIEQLKEELQTEKARAEDYLKRLKYLKADLENFQKRTKKEMERIQKVGIVNLLAKLLTIVDDLERAVSNAHNSNKELTNSTFFDGVMMISDQFNKILKEEGVKKIEALGKRMDPRYHEVVCRIESSDHPNNTIIEEYRKGYLLDDEVIRPATVAVSKIPKIEEKIEDDSTKDDLTEEESIKDDSTNNNDTKKMEV